MTFSRRALGGVLLVLILAFVGSGTALAGDAVLDDLESRKADVEADRTEVGAQVDALTADVDDALAELDRRAELASAAARDAAGAEADADAAAGVAARSSSSTDLARSAYANARDRVRAVAVERYVGAPQAVELEGLLKGDLFSGATIDVVFEAVVGREHEGAEEIAAAADVLAERRNAASTATTEAQRLAEEAVRARVRAEAAEAEYVEFLTALQDRLDHTLAEADALEELDADLADQIRRREVELARRLPPRPPDGGFTIGRPVPIEETVIAAGFRVHNSVAGQVEAMVTAAAADGIVLTGGGYRDGAAQIALRRAHCGETDYDIYERPPSECHPPTARPTHSMHEQGLALDLATPAGLIVTRLDPAYQWLIVHAEEYGFFNLPSEPWHWSTSGR
jgi:D-alanyl-D-alanine carboxypeptidase